MSDYNRRGEDVSWPFLFLIILWLCITMFNVTHALNRLERIEKRWDAFNAQQVEVDDE